MEWVASRHLGQLYHSLAHYALSPMIGRAALKPISWQLSPYSVPFLPTSQPPFHTRLVPSLHHGPHTTAAASRCSPPSDLPGTSHQRPLLACTVTTPSHAHMRGHSLLSPLTDRTAVPHHLFLLPLPSCTPSSPTTPGSHGRAPPSAALTCTCTPHLSIRRCHSRLVQPRPI